MGHSAGRAITAHGGYSSRTKSGPVFRIEVEPLLRESHRSAPRSGRAKHPEATAHVEEAQAAGQPSELTIDRTGAKVRGREALRDYPSKSGKDRDEYPPKMFEEGGKGRLSD